MLPYESKSLPPVFKFGATLTFAQRVTQHLTPPQSWQ